MEYDNDDLKTMEPTAEDQVESPNNQSLDDDAIYHAIPQEPNPQDIEEQKENQATKKSLKTAVKGAATYFGGPVGNQVADAVNKSKIGNKIYDKVGNQINKNPIMKPIKKKLAQADDAGLIDAADKVVDVAGANAKGVTKNATQAATTAKAASTANTTKTTATANNASHSSGNNNLPKKNVNSSNSNNGNENTENLNTNNENMPNKKNRGVSTTSGENPEEKNQKEKKGEADNKLLDFLKKHPLLLIYLGLGVFLFLLIILIIVALSGNDFGESDVALSYIDPRYDFNQSVVTITDANGNELDEVPFAEFIKGATYAELYSNIDDLSDDELLQVTKAYMLVIKSLTLQAGNYNSENKQMQILSGNNGIPYCDIYNGCNIYSYNGGYLYLTSKYDNANLGTAVNSIDAADSDIINIIEKAYQETYNLLLMPNNYNTILTNFPQTSIPYNQNIKSNWLNLVKSTDEYEELIKNINEYQNYKIYNISEYSATYNYSSSTAYWWPLGSGSSSSKIDTGNPVSIRITSQFGYRTDPITGKANKKHNGLDIGASCGINVIATRTGKVIEATENSSCGFYVKIDHGDGTASRYCHMLSDLQVKKGQTVEQGTVIGHVGSTGDSTGCHLHFEVWKNNSRVNPLDYVNTSNPRPKSQISVASVNGSSSMQSVCLTLKSSGFSNDAVAAIMSNMRQESNFRLDAVGDNGTSYGLCQWHNGRYNKLQNYCGSSLNTVECQLSYLINELQTSYVGVYNMLLTNNTAHDLTEYYCYYYEVPANRETSCANRANNYANSFLNYVNNGCK